MSMPQKGAEKPLQKSGMELQEELLPVVDLPIELAEKKAIVKINSAHKLAEKTGIASGEKLPQQSGEKLPQKCEEKLPQESGEKLPQKSGE